MLMEGVHIVNAMDITWGYSARTALNLRKTDLIYPLKSPSVFLVNWKNIIDKIDKKRKKKVSCHFFADATWDWYFII